MKKIISTVILGVLVLGLLAPMLATAQSTKLKEYCTLKNNIAWKSGRICKGATAGTEEDTSCDADPGTYTDGDCVTGAETNCALKSGDTIGPSYLTAISYDADDVANEWVSHYTDQWGMVCLVNSVTTVTNWIFYLLMIVVVVMIVIGGATYMLAAGNPEKAGKGKTIIIYGIVGLIIALLARLIPSVVKLIVGMG